MIRRIALVLALTASLAQAQTPEQLYTQGQHAYDQKHYDDAVTLWTRSYDASHLPALLFNIAQAYRLRARPGDCTKAVELYRKFLDLDPSSPQRATAQGLIAELTPCPAVTPEPPPPVAPAQPVPQTVVVVQPMPSSPQPAVTDSDAGSGKRIAGIVVAGGSVAVIATGLYFGHKASQLGDEVTAACKAGCIWSTVASKDADGKSAETKQWILLGVGAAGLVAGGVLYYLGTNERSGTHVAVVPRGDGATLSWSESW